MVYFYLLIHLLNTYLFIIYLYYILSKTKIAIPAGQLESPFFNADYPSALNYGNIGATVGHELTHGLDNDGRKFDEIGNLHNWWSEEAVKRFKQRSECFITQYGSLRETNTGMKVCEYICNIYDILF